MSVRKKRTRAYFGSKSITVEDSTLVNRVYYDPETDTLDAVFATTGVRYRYRRVPPKIFAQFVLAKSMGKFFNQKIKNSYVVEKAR